MVSPARYKMGTVTRLTGLSAGLLRIWERRYDLVRPHRTEGGHRMYTQEDLRLLMYVKSELDGGASIGEVARMGREALLDASAPNDPPAVHLPADLPVAPRVRSSIERWREELADAAQALDVASLEHTLDEAFAALNPDVVIYQVIHQASHEIGDRWERGEMSVAGEHLASGVFARRLLRLMAASRGIKPGSPKAVAACFPDERHELGALVQAWELSRSGYDVAWLGAALPLEALELALRAVKPTAVFLSTSIRSTYDAAREDLAALIERTPKGACWMVGGHGVPASDRLLQDLDVGLAPELVAGEKPKVPSYDGANCQDVQRRAPA